VGGEETSAGPLSVLEGELLLPPLPPPQAVSSSAAQARARRAGRWWRRMGADVRRAAIGTVTPGCHHVTRLTNSNKTRLEFAASVTFARSPARG